MTKKLDSYERVEIKSVEALHKWLDENHKQKTSIWLVSFKKHTGRLYVSYDAIVDQAIAYGWIDSLPRKLDEDRTMLLLSPRKAGSAWSRVNKNRVARLLADGKMHGSGLACIEQAKQDGSWTFLDDVEDLIVPEDLGEVLDQHPPARSNFRAFPRSVQRGILEWIKQARRPATRTKRIHATATLAAKNQRANYA